MNNKKLFKGALVLFASILMAVSCQSNSNPDGDKNNTTTPEQPGADKTLKIDLADDNKKEAVPSTSTLKIINGDGGTVAPTAKIKFAGDDIASLGTVTLEAVTGLEASSGVRKPNDTHVTERTADNLKDKQSVVLANFELKGNNDAGYEITVRDTKKTDVFNDSDNSNGKIIKAHWGGISATLKITDKNNTKEAKTVTVYIAVGNNKND